MRRRAFLAILAVSGALGGCQGRGSQGRSETAEPPPTTATATPTETPTSAAGPPSRSEKTTPPNLSPTFPRPEPIQFMKRGGGTTATFSLRGDGPTIFEIGHEGDGPFTVKLRTAGRKMARRWTDLVAATGNFTGEVMVWASEDTYYLDVETDGLWGTVITQPAPPDSGTPVPHGASAVGPLPVGPVEFAGRTRLNVLVSDGDRYVIWLLNRFGGRVDRVIEGRGRGPTENLSTTFTVERIGYLQVHTTAQWSMELKHP